MGSIWTCSMERMSTAQPPEVEGFRRPYSAVCSAATMATVAEFAEELEAATTNYEVATALAFENDRIRVWEMHLEPGERMPFHCHRTAYFWICHAGGRGIQRFPDGTLWHVEFAAGDVDFID